MERRREKNGAKDKVGKTDEFFDGDGQKQEHNAADLSGKWRAQGK